jgi:hypothetical protein
MPLAEPSHTYTFLSRDDLGLHAGNLKAIMAHHLYTSANDQANQSAPSLQVRT